MARTARTWGPGVVVALLLVAAWPTPPARANGNYSHVWVAADAVRYVPAGPLKDFLAREGLVNIVRNGAMYPDGGYAVDDGYGEISHWEPFHHEYLKWIRETYSPPWPDDAAKHIAFLMGMTAHGLTDQFYDGMYLSRHEVFDPYVGDAPFGLDGATDSCFAATQGEMELPDPWMPAEDLAPLYDALDHHVEADVIAQGSAFVPFAVAHANAEAANPATIAELTAFYPWACQHQADPAVPGSPVTCGPAIAAYWQILWHRLHGLDGFDEPLLGTFFTNGSPWNYPSDSTSPDSWVSFAMPRGLRKPSVTTDSVTVTREGGEAHPVKVQVYYGEGSHLVNVKPLEDWAASAIYTVTISPPVKSWDDLPLAAPLSFTFGTVPAPPEPVPEVVEASEPVPDLAPDAADALDAAEDVATDVPAPDAFDVPDATGPGPDAAGDPAGNGDPGTTGGGTSGGCSAGATGASWITALLPGLLFVTAAGRRRPRRE